MARRSEAGRGTRSYRPRLVNTREPKQHFARTLLAQYEPPDPANDNPSTIVHLLVEELLRYAR